MENHWNDRISDYLDGDMTADEAQIFEDRMAEDPALAAQVEAVRAVVRDAGRLEGIDPPAHLWRSIEAQLPARSNVVDLEFERTRRGWGFARWQAVAAAVTLMVISGAMGWILRGGEAPDSTVGPQIATTPTAERTTEDPYARVEAVNARFDEENAHLAESIRELETALLESRDNLDEETRAIVEDNLILIDQAIREALAALGQDPDSDYLRNHLASTMQRKARLLTDATRLSRREI